MGWGVVVVWWVIIIWWVGELLLFGRSGSIFWLGWLLLFSGYTSSGFSCGFPSLELSCGLPFRLMAAPPPHDWP